MKILVTLTLAAALSSPAWCSDLVVKKEKHTDAAPVMNQPAQDSVEVTWIGKDRMRTEEGERVTLVRADLKKMYMLDTKAKTFSTLDLPFDLKKAMPAEMAPMMEQMMGQMKVTVTPTTETKKIKDWNATRYTVTVTMPMGGSSTQEMWVTKEIGVDPAAWQDMYGALMSAANPMGGGMTAEMKKIDGFPVLIERTQKVMSSEIKSKEAVISVEQKEPAADFYDVPKDYIEKPFDPMAGMGMKMGGPGAHGPRRG